MYQNKQAFTLIELLVVVLIIGILAAVALPQYQKAVLKSQYVQLMVSGDAIYKAEKVYYLANGKYTSNLKELDVTLINNDDVHYTCYAFESYSEMYCFLRGDNRGLGYHIYIGSGKKACLASQNHEKTLQWEQFCTNITGKNTGGINAGYRWFDF